MVKEVHTSLFQQDPLVSELQKAVNCARKAEARVREVEQDKAARQEQWHNWEQALKKSYTKEKQGHRMALEKLDREGEAALLDLQEAQAGPPMQQEYPTISSASAESQAEKDFNEFLEAADVSIGVSMDIGHTDQDEVIRRALHSGIEPAATTTALSNLGAGGSRAVQALTTPTRRTGVPPMTPLARTSTAADTSRMEAGSRPHPLAEMEQLHIQVARLGQLPKTLTRLHRVCRC